MSASAKSQNMGRIKQVIGPIVDVEFESGSPSRDLSRGEGHQRCH